MGEGALTVSRNGEEESLPFGTCVWATGIAMHPLVGVASSACLAALGMGAVGTSAAGGT